VGYVKQDKRGELTKGDLIDGMLKLGETLTDAEAGSFPFSIIRLDCNFSLPSMDRRLKRC
jgi:hypothetical protein